MLNVTLLCSDINHPVFSYLQAWCDKSQSLYNIQLVSTTTDIKNENGLLFLVSCSEFIKKNIRDKFDHAVVLHASDLPFGRGWSPHIWDIIHGKCEIVLSLLNAEAEIDTGDVWKKIRISLDGSELYDEINHKLFTSEIELIDWFCQNYRSAVPVSQQGETHYYEKRKPEDSQIDPEKSIAEQFNLLRVCDPNRFPAYFIINGIRYNIKITKGGLNE